MKVIGIGFHKTGTTTLDMALRILGYKVLGNRTDLAKKLLDDDIEEAFELVEGYDAFQDNPWPLLYKEFDKRYKGCKFILTLREEEKWIKSVVNHFGEKHTEMRRWIYGVGYPKGNESIYLDRYRLHNREVMEYFKNRKEDFIILSWEKGDGWDELCSFLNKPIPKKSFPHANKGYYSKQTRFVINQINRAKNFTKLVLGKLNP